MAQPPIKNFWDALEESEKKMEERTAWLRTEPVAPFSEETFGRLLYAFTGSTDQSLDELEDARTEWEEDNPDFAHFVETGEVRRKDPVAEKALEIQPAAGKAPEIQLPHPAAEQALKDDPVTMTPVPPPRRPSGRRVSNPHKRPRKDDGGDLVSSPLARMKLDDLFITRNFPTTDFNLDNPAYKQKGVTETNVNAVRRSLDFRSWRTAKESSSFMVVGDKPSERGRGMWSGQFPQQKSSRATTPADHDFSELPHHRPTSGMEFDDPPTQPSPGYTFDPAEQTYDSDLDLDPESEAFVGFSPPSAQQGLADEEDEDEDEQEDKQEEDGDRRSRAPESQRRRGYGGRGGSEDEEDDGGPAATPPSEAVPAKSALNANKRLLQMPIKLRTPLSDGTSKEVEIELLLGSNMDGLASSIRGVVKGYLVAKATDERANRVHLFLKGFDKPPGKWQCFRQCVVARTQESKWHHGRKQPSPSAACHKCTAVGDPCLIMGAARDCLILLARVEDGGKQWFDRAKPDGVPQPLLPFDEVESWVDEEL